MARDQIVEQGWPVAPYLVPAGAVLDTRDWQWNELKLPRPPPIDAVMCLDQAAHDEMIKHYELYAFRILTPPGSDINLTDTVIKRRNWPSAAGRIGIKFYLSLSNFGDVPGNDG